VVDDAYTLVAGPTLSEALRGRRPGEVVVVVSDITRPVPYVQLLPELLREIEGEGVPRDEITILIATGMHRPSTAGERDEMLGEAGRTHRVVDHRADDDSQLVELPGPSAAGATVRLNRRYVEAGFRLITGLVEPHFMAGFSGGRKAICPGLASLDTIQHFHGAAILGDPRAANGVLEGNPCHEEALSVARMVPPDFTLNVVLDRQRRVVRSFAGPLEEAHLAACDFVRDCACPMVHEQADVVVTSSGGHPLDATFYQCVKGFVSCLPAVKPGGHIIALGGCSEGIGSAEYADLMARYAGRWREFLEDIRRPGVFTKDQWELQVHCRALEKVGQENLHFVTDGLSPGELSRLSVNGHGAEPGEVREVAQALLDELAGHEASVAVIPDGSYCAPLSS
jgi:nickel-dependent lactate racemase